MAFNVNRGRENDAVPVEATVKSGDLVRVGDLVGIAQTDAKLVRAGHYESTVNYTGIANFPVTGAVLAGTTLYVSTAPGANNIGVKVDTLTEVSATPGVGDAVVGHTNRGKPASQEDVWVQLAWAPKYVEV